MKTSNVLALGGILLIFSLGCHDENGLFNPTSETGGLIMNIGLDISVTEHNARTGAVPVEDFKVMIHHSDGSVFLEFEDFGSMPDTVKLSPGEYYISASSGNFLLAAFDNPYYYGESEIFSIQPGETIAATVLCSLANCRVSVEYSDNIKSDYHHYYTEITIGDTALVFVMDEMRSGYFDMLPLTIRACLEYERLDGTFYVKELTGAITNPEPKKHYIIRLDATLPEPSIGLQIQIDESEISEFIFIADSGRITPEGQIPYGDLLITEIMYNPLALPDTEGEWFEIYNAGEDTINLKDLVIKRGTTNTHIISDSINLYPGSFCALVRTIGACEANNKYLFGSSISLPNTGDDLAIFNYGTDGSDGNLIIRVNYSVSSGFPDGNGKSISLDPGKFTSEHIQAGSNWCLGSTPYSTGDYGSPGVMNDHCN